MTDQQRQTVGMDVRLRRSLAIVIGALFVVVCWYVAVLLSAPCESETWGWVVMLLLGAATVSVARRRWLAGGAVVVVALGLAAVLRNDLPFVARWAVSRASFDAHVAHDAAPVRARRIGLFYVHAEEISPDGARWFQLTAAGECDACAICLECGVVWLPPSLEVPSDHESFRPIGGRWYLFKKCT